jgi:hypothetical protein
VGIDPCQLEAGSLRRNISAWAGFKRVYSQGICTIHSHNLPGTLIEHRQQLAVVFLFLIPQTHSQAIADRFECLRSNWIVRFWFN